MAAPPDDRDKTKDFDGDEDHDDATMMTSADEMERMRAEIAAAGVGSPRSAVSAPPAEPKPPERTTLPPEHKIILSPELTGAQRAMAPPPNKTGLYAAIAVCALGVGVLLVALLRR